jgi:hypothetical protein
MPLIRYVGAIIHNPNMALTKIKREVSHMSVMPEYAGKFTSFRVYEAICQTEEDEEILLIEFRVTALEEQLLYTVVKQKPIRGAIHELVHLCRIKVYSYSAYFHSVDDVRTGIVTETFGLFETLKTEQ